MAADDVAKEQHGNSKDVLEPTNRKLHQPKAAALLQR